MEFLEIADAIGNLTVLVVIAAAVIYLLVKYFSKKIDNVSNLADLQQRDGLAYDSVLTLKDTHPYFSKVYTILEIKIPITKIGGPIRTEIFRDVLKIFYEAQKEIVYDLLTENITEENFLQENLKAANKMIKKADENMKLFGIPQIVREKFWEWYSKRHDYITSTLSDIDSSIVFKTIVEKEYAALSLFQSCAYFTLMDAENTLRNLNGDLTGTIYNGKVIESLNEGEKR